ncbi:hypothetical protein NOR_07477 [Metarhizium rileyi]|uniref:Uncharacterized protein n=1 Tax=Metarhizium rileyi (strain RCEF 4871) TaxID=1649241 RepID=A0A166Y9S6_METRR|nr:hypothetical protein NOR_07477 [Metarhizium rileyi RCEF 4871]TWU71882.1 hypothetical protein ED733_000760 [Metarhizium rileyi]
MDKYFDDPEVVQPRYQLAAALKITGEMMETFMYCAYQCEYTTPQLKKHEHAYNKMLKFLEVIANHFQVMHTDSNSPLEDKDKLIEVRGHCVSMLLHIYIEIKYEMCTYIELSEATDHCKLAQMLDLDTRVEDLEKGFAALKKMCMDACLVNPGPLADAFKAFLE